MSFESNRASWEWLARHDPLWAILSDPAKQGGHWNIDDFFSTGKEEVERVFAYLEKKGIAPPDRMLALDFGCGVGRLTRALAARMDEVHGIDVSQNMVARARELNQGAPGRMSFFLNRDRDLSMFADASYSFIYSSIVLQHIPYPESLGYVREFFRLAKPGGLVVFQVPTLDRTRLPRRVARALLRRVAQMVRLPMPALHIEMNVIPEAEIRSAALAAGAEVIDVVYTNSVESNANGGLRFEERDGGGRLASCQFSVIASAARRGLASRSAP
jgi:2-polyprenyl-3-methyl-5-hydroxy-6-metoxy-1,4-benzoquinol methylase